MVSLGGGGGKKIFCCSLNYMHNWVQKWLSERRDGFSKGINLITNLFTTKRSFVMPIADPAEIAG